MDIRETYTVNLNTLFQSNLDGEGQKAGAEKRPGISAGCRLWQDFALENKS